MMKKTLAILLILILVLSGCGAKEKAEEKAEEKAIEKATEEAIEAISDELGEDVEVETDDGTTTITTEDGGELVVATDGSTGVPVPEDYPSDVLPIYSEEYIALATNTEAGYTLSGYTKDSMEEVIAYYEKAISEGTVMIKEMDEEYYMNMGQLMEQTYSITVMPGDDETGYTTNFTITVMPAMGTIPDMGGLDMNADLDSEDKDDEAKDDSSNSEPSAEADLIVPDQVEWPNDYPEKQLPVYPRGATEVDIVEQDSESTMVGLKTEDEVDVVLEYYRDLLSGAPDFSEINMAPMTMLDGTIDGQEFTITIIENGEFTAIDLKFKTLIQIVYY